MTGNDGSTYSLPPAGGTQAVDPPSTTIYTATAVGTAGAAVSATATVTVIPPAAPPTVTITANPASISSGGSSTLTVTAANATQVTVSGSDGSSYSLQPTGGTQAVSPTTTTTYTATATGSAGTVSATATATVTVGPPGGATVTITANPSSIATGNSSTLTVTATNATAVTVSGSDGSSYTMKSGGGTQAVTPAATTTYTATATGTAGNATATVTVTVGAPGTINSVNHVIFMLQENHSFDNYFGMLNPYRPKSEGWTKGDDGNTYNVDGIDDKLTTISNTDREGDVYPLFKLTSTCIDDDSSDWLASYGDVSTYNVLLTRPIKMDGFVHNAEGYADSCASANSCSGSFTDLTGKRAMGYYDQNFFNYYYYMASQFAISDRWFSPVASKTIDNRIATFTGGTTQGLVKDPGDDDHLPQLSITTIFQELDQAKVSWKIYYTVTEGLCLSEDDCTVSGKESKWPATTFSDLSYSYQYLHAPPCSPPTQPSSVVGDSTNSFCIDPTHIAPISQYFTDLTNNTLPSFAFIEAGYGHNDEHPGSAQSVLLGQTQVSSILNAFMGSSSWSNSVFFLAYDEGGGPYDHVPPVPNHSNDFTNTTTLGATPPDISSIAVNPDSNPNYYPCVPPGGVATLHCDLSTDEAGANPADAPSIEGFGAQLGFRIPNMVISPFTRRHYVSHIPMDHTAVIKFVENRFIGSSTHLTARDAAQPDLLDFFDFTGIPWATPPTPPAPVTQTTLGYNPCDAANMGP